MTQLHLRQLVKLLTEWQAQFCPNPERELNAPDEAQPYYVEMVALVSRQVQREIE